MTVVHRIFVEIEGLHFALRSYSVLMLLAVVVGLWLGPWSVTRLEGLDRNRVYRALLLIGLGVVVGARLHFVLVHWATFSSDPLRILNIWSGRIYAAGAIVSLAVCAPLVLRRLGVPLGKFADGFAPALGIGMGIQRVGCFLEGCCFGTLCSWPWGTTFPRHTSVYQFHRTLGVIPENALRTAPVHPLQLYFVGTAFLMTVVALWVHPRKRYDGQVGLIALLVYSVGSAVLEFFRADYAPRVSWGPLPQRVWIGVALTGALLATFSVAEVARRTKGRDRPRAD